MSSVIKTKNKLIIFIILCLSILLFPITSQSLNIYDIPLPYDATKSWVSDTANILNNHTETQLDRIINNLQADSGISIAVVTIPEIESENSPQKLARELYTTWIIDKPQPDKSILFLVSAKSFKSEITAGLDLKNVLSDARVARIIETHVTPYLQKKDFDTGVLNGIRVIVSFLQKAELNTAPIRTKLSTVNFLIDKVLPIIFGIVASLYYYYLTKQVVKQKKDLVVLQPVGFTRKQLYASYYDFNVRSLLVYILLYICCFFASLFAITPILKIATPLWIVGLLAIHIIWIIQVRQNILYQSKDYIFLTALLMIASPLILMWALTSSALFVVILLCGITVYLWHQEKNRENNEDKLDDYIFIDNEDKRKSIASTISIVIANIILGLIILLIGSWFLKNYSFSYQPEKIFWSLELSVIIFYLTWQSYQKKLLMGCHAEAQCACCQKSLNRINGQNLKKYLKSPENIAQKLKNVTYQGWYCSSCNPRQQTPLNRSQIHLIAYIAKYLKAPQCPTCKELTITHKSQAIEKATNHKPELRLYTYTCQCCKYSYTEEKIITHKSIFH